MIIDRAMYCDGRRVGAPATLTGVRKACTQGGGSPGAGREWLEGRPTLIGTIYGMSFRGMPELHWRFGYPDALALMLALSLDLCIMFKKRDRI